MRDNFSFRATSYVAIYVLIAILSVINLRADDHVFLPRFKENLVTVIDEPSNTVLVNVPVGSGPFDLAAKPDGSRIYVANLFSHDISVIDTNSNAVVATIPVGGSPFSIRVSPNGARLYVTDGTANAVHVIDTATNTILTDIPVGSFPSSIAITPDGKRAFVTNEISFTVSVLDLAANVETASFAAGNFPARISVSPVGSRGYIAHNSSDPVFVFDTTLAKITGSIALAVGGMAFAPDGSRGYFDTSSGILIIDPASNAVINNLGFESGGIAVSPDGKRLYLSWIGNTSIALASLDTVNNSVISTLPITTLTPPPEGADANGLVVVNAGNACNTPTQFNLLDPVPALLSGPAVTNDFNLLATNGRGVSGTAADGVTQLLIRLPATSVGDRFDLKIVDDQGHDSASPENDGAVANVVSPSFLSSATVFAVQTQGGPMAFALYQAPKDFPRPGGIDAGAANRKVSIQVQTPTSCGSVPIKIIRPPVMLIHGLWSDPSTWDDFQPLITDARFSTYRVNYQSTNADGFLANAGLVVLPQVRTFIREFKNLKAVAAVQADVVTHSMGGDITRTMPLLLLYRRSGNFNQGEVHKLITLDTPHLGSDLAPRLFSSGFVCKSVWGFAGKPIGDAVRDLQPGSSALRALTRTVFPLQTHVLAGIANTGQESGLQLPIENWKSMLLSQACPNLLPPTGIRSVFGQSSDLLVSQPSEEAAGLGFLNTTIPFDDIPNVVHSVDPVLFRIGPDVLSRTFNFSTNQIDPASTSVPSRVIDLLNEPVTSSAFAAILP